MLLEVGAADEEAHARGHVGDQEGLLVLLLVEGEREVDGRIDGLGADAGELDGRLERPRRKAVLLGELARREAGAAARVDVGVLEDRAAVRQDDRDGRAPAAF